MDASLIDDTDLPLARKSRLPGTGFFEPDELEEAARDAAVADTLDTYDRLIVTDTDADGLGSAAIIMAVEGDAGLVPSGPHDLDDSLERILARSAAVTELTICDLAPDGSDTVVEHLERAIEEGTTVRWFDHHQWEPSVAQAVRDIGVELTIGASETVCTADVVVDSLSDPIPERFIELAAVTRDHDLWIKDDPRSDDLADYAYWAEPEAYVETVRDHGVDLPPDVEAELADRRVEKAALIDRAAERARLHTIQGITVGVTYGRCSQNEVADRLREQGADAAVIVKPAGSASIRGSEAFERCHEVAGLVNGGGHPRAAGCKPDIYDDMLDYATHWVTNGAVAQQTILDAFETVLTED